MKVTIREVAKRAGVSVTTVSRVLNGHDLDHMRPETKARVLDAIEELDYTPVRAAQRLRKQKTQVIAVLLPDISNPFFSLLTRGVESVAFDQGFSALICDSNHSVEKESRYLEILLEERVEGVVFIPVGQPDGDRVQKLLSRGIKIVLADRRVEGLPTVEADNRGGSCKLTEYLLKLGYREIAYIAGPQEVSTTLDRLAGFHDAMAKASIEPVVVHHGKFTYESGYAHAQEILANYQVDAIMAGNDLIAIGAIKAAEDLDLRVPEDLGVTGFDHIPLLDLMQPRLTTVHIPAYQIGQEAMKMFIKYIKNGNQGRETKVLEIKLIKGGSCKWKY